MQFQVSNLKDRVYCATLPEDLTSKLTDQLDRLEFIMKSGGGSSFSAYDQIERYITWVLSLPWNTSSEDILDISRAKSMFDKNHYGLDKIKQRILEYVSVIILQRHKASDLGAQGEYTSIDNASKPAAAGKFHAPILCFVGLVGTGKTTMAVSMAQALNRKLVRIPFGGLSSGLDLRGLSRTHAEAEPGIVMRSLRRVHVKNPVILLDELDRVSDEKRNEIMGVLVELLDPEQNKAFTDHYIDYPFDLSEAIFVATANNINKIATAVLDRMEIIQMPSYSDDEKLYIAKEYLLPRAIKEVALDADTLRIEENVWPFIIRPLGFDPGIRTLNRRIQGMVRKCAWKILNHDGTQFLVTERNYREFVEA